MSSPNPFLQAILDNPDDDTPRLVFADWLEEHGDPVRAEFIRVQCAFAKMKDVAWDDPEKRTLRRRADDLLMKHRNGWLLDLPRAAQWDCRPRFERGFVEELSCTVSQVLKVVAGVFRVAPIRGLDLANHGAWELWDRFARCRHLTRLQELRIQDLDFGDRGVELLAASPFLTNLRRLALSGTGIGDRGASELVGASKLQHLLVLDLRGRNPIGEPGRQALRNRFGSRVLLPD
jgi:uncharacterized protein (TIGR02996 family)